MSQQRSIKDLTSEIFDALGCAMLKETGGPIYISKLLVRRLHPQNKQGIMVTELKVEMDRVIIATFPGNAPRPVINPTQRVPLMTKDSGHITLKAVKFAPSGTALGTD